MNCPICDDPLEYMGIEDGGGDYADEIVEVWWCETCREYHDGTKMQVHEPRRHSLSIWIEREKARLRRWLDKLRASEPEDLPF